jgi:hypothetical protein
VRAADSPEGTRALHVGVDDDGRRPAPAAQPAQTRAADLGRHLADDHGRAWFLLPPLLVRFPLPIVTLLITAIVVPLMGYVVMPLLTSCCREWLRR